MPIDLEQYRRLKSKADSAKADYDRAEGALSQLMLKLKEDFSCDSVDEAEELLKVKKKERDEAEEQYQTLLKKFEEKWGDRL